MYILPKPLRGVAWVRDTRDAVRQNQYRFLKAFARRARILVEDLCYDERGFRWFPACMDWLNGIELAPRAVLMPPRDLTGTTDTEYRTALASCRRRRCELWIVPLDRDAQSELVYAPRYRPLPGVMITTPQNWERRT